LKRLSAIKNNIRPKVWIEKLNARKRTRENNVGVESLQGKDGDLDPSLVKPTPGYNAAILEDIAIPIQQLMLQQASLEFKCFSDVLILLKVTCTDRLLCA